MAMTRACAIECVVGGRNNIAPYPVNAPYVVRQVSLFIRMSEI